MAEGLGSGLGVQNLLSQLSELSNYATRFSYCMGVSREKENMSYMDYIPRIPTDHQ